MANDNQRKSSPFQSDAERRIVENSYDLLSGSRFGKKQPRFGYLGRFSPHSMMFSFLFFCFFLSCCCVALPCSVPLTRSSQTYSPIGGIVASGNTSVQGPCAINSPQRPSPKLPTIYPKLTHNLPIHYNINDHKRQEPRQQETLPISTIEDETVFPLISFFLSDPLIFCHPGKTPVRLLTPGVVTLSTAKQHAERKYAASQQVHSPAYVSRIGSFVAGAQNNAGPRALKHVFAKYGLAEQVGTRVFHKSIHGLSRDLRKSHADLPAQIEIGNISSRSKETNTFEKVQALVLGSIEKRLPGKMMNRGKTFELDFLERDWGPKMQSLWNTKCVMCYEETLELFTDQYMCYCAVQLVQSCLTSCNNPTTGHCLSHPVALLKFTELDPIEYKAKDPNTAYLTYTIHPFPAEAIWQMKAEVKTDKAGGYRMQFDANGEYVTELLALVGQQNGPISNVPLARGGDAEGKAKFLTQASRRTVINAPNNVEPHCDIPHTQPPECTSSPASGLWRNDPRQTCIQTLKSHRLLLFMAGRGLPDIQLSDRFAVDELFKIEVQVTQILNNFDLGEAGLQDIVVHAFTQAGKMVFDTLERHYADSAASPTSALNAKELALTDAVMMTLELVAVQPAAGKNRLALYLSDAEYVAELRKQPCFFLTVGKSILRFQNVAMMDAHLGYSLVIENIPLGPGLLLLDSPAARAALMQQILGHTAGLVSFGKTVPGCESLANKIQVYDAFGKVVQGEDILDSEFLFLASGFPIYLLLREERMALFGPGPAGLKGGARGEQPRTVNFAIKAANSFTAACMVQSQSMYPSQLPGLEDIAPLSVNGHALLLKSSDKSTPGRYLLGSSLKLTVANDKNLPDCIKSDNELLSPQNHTIPTSLLWKIWESKTLALYCVRASEATLTALKLPRLVLTENMWTNENITTVRNLTLLSTHHSPPETNLTKLLAGINPVTWKLYDTNELQKTVTPSENTNTQEFMLRYPQNPKEQFTALMSSVAAHRILLDCKDDDMPDHHRALSSDKLFKSTLSKGGKAAITASDGIATAQNNISTLCPQSHPLILSELQMQQVQGGAERFVTICEILSQCQRTGIQNSDPNMLRMIKICLIHPAQHLQTWTAYPNAKHEPSICHIAKTSISLKLFAFLPAANFGVCLENLKLLAEFQLLEDTAAAGAAADGSPDPFALYNAGRLRPAEFKPQDLGLAPSFPGLDDLEHRVPSCAPTLMHPGIPKKPLASTQGYLSHPNLYLTTLVKHVNEDPNEYQMKHQPQTCMTSDVPYIEKGSVHLVTYESQTHTTQTFTLHYLANKNCMPDIDHFVLVSYQLDGGGIKNFYVTQSNALSTGRGNNLIVLPDSVHPSYMGDSVTATKLDNSTLLGPYEFNFIFPSRLAIQSALATEMLLRPTMDYLWIRMDHPRTWKLATRGDCLKLPNIFQHPIPSQPWITCKSQTEQRGATYVCYPHFPINPNPQYIENRDPPNVNMNETQRSPKEQLNMCQFNSAAYGELISVKTVDIPWQDGEGNTHLYIVSNSRSFLQQHPQLKIIMDLNHTAVLKIEGTLLTWSPPLTSPIQYKTLIPPFFPDRLCEDAISRLGNSDFRQPTTRTFLWATWGLQIVRGQSGRIVQGLRNSMLFIAEVVGLDLFFEIKLPRYLSLNIRLYENWLHPVSVPGFWTLCGDIRAFVASGPQLLSSSEFAKGLLCTAVEILTVVSLTYWSNAATMMWTLVSRRTRQHRRILSKAFFKSRRDKHICTALSIIMLFLLAGITYSKNSKAYSACTRSGNSNNPEKFQQREHYDEWSGIFLTLKFAALYLIGTLQMQSRQESLRQNNKYVQPTRAIFRATCIARGKQHNKRTRTAKLVQKACTIFIKTSTHLRSIPGTLKCALWSVTTHFATAIGLSHCIKSETGVNETLQQLRTILIAFKTEHWPLFALHLTTIIGQAITLPNVMVLCTIIAYTACKINGQLHLYRAHKKERHAKISLVQEIAKQRIHMLHLLDLLQQENTKYNQRGGGPSTYAAAARSAPKNKKTSKKTPSEHILLADNPRTHWTQHKRSWMTAFELDDYIKVVLEPMWKNNPHMLTDQHSPPYADLQFVEGLENPANRVSLSSSSRALQSMQTKNISPYFITNPGNKHWRVILLDSRTKRIYYIDPMGRNTDPTSSLCFPTATVHHALIDKIGNDFSTHINTKIYQQDGYNCGIWSLYITEIWAQYLEEENTEDFLSYLDQTTRESGLCQAGAGDSLRQCYATRYKNMRKGPPGAASPPKRQYRNWLIVDGVRVHTDSHDTQEIANQFRDILLLYLNREAEMGQPAETYTSPVFDNMRGRALEYLSNQIRQQIQRRTEFEASPYDVPRDGNCLFSALSYFIHGDIAYNHEIRLAIVEYIADHWAEYKVDILFNYNDKGVNSPETYKKYMSTPKEWSGPPEARAAASLWKYGISLWNRDNNVKTHHFCPDSITQYNLNFTGAHFQCLIPKTTQSPPHQIRRLS